MLKLIPNPTFKADVKLTTPDGDGVVTLEFKHLGKKALKEWVKTSSEKPDGDSLGAVVAGWSGVYDQEGKPVPFSQMALETLLDSYGASALEIVNVYLKALTESRVKN